MNKKKVFLAVSLLLIFNFYSQVSSDSFLKRYNNGNIHQQIEEQRFVQGQIVIKTQDETFDFPGIGSEISRQTQGEIVRQKHLTRILFYKYHTKIKNIKPALINDYYIIETHDNCDIKTFKQRLLTDPLVEDASLNYIAAITAEPPNDPYFQYQYALHNTGQVYEPDTGLQGTAGSDINALEAWQWSTGGEDIIIAVIDSGVAIYHEDLVHKVVPGYNFVSDNYDPYDDHGHGTFVASIAAAETNNAIGMAGVSWNSKIMPIKTMDKEGYGSYLAIGAGIRYAADQGSKVINISVGGRSPSFILEDACEYAFNRGCVIVASAGNTASAVLYPAAYDDYCLAVGASDADDNLASWSNYGPQLDVVAPGAFVFGALFLPNEPDILNSYGWGNGTSYATPYVSGAAALLIHYKPFLSNTQVMDLIKYTADDVNQAIHPGIDIYMGYGRINLQTLLGPYEL